MTPDNVIPFNTNIQPRSKSMTPTPHVETATPLLPAISPQHIRQVAYHNAKLWLDGLIWQDLLPKTDPPQKGSEAVRILGRTLAPTQRVAFIDGWNRALDEWEARREFFLNRALAPQKTSLRFKAAVWAASLTLCLAFWWLMAAWWL